VSYLSLIDIVDFRTAIREMARVVRPNGILLVANPNSFITPCAAQSWVKDEGGKRLHYPVDRFLDEFL
jgi:ubiquinone/menaquinone biosynthesis C-methylase UbiE